MPLTIDDFGKLLRAKRGALGVRAIAAQVGISPATYSRVENGNMPDLETFAELCKWLDRDPREFLGFEHPDSLPTPAAVVHFKKKKVVKPETATALGEMILAAQAAARARNQLIRR